MTKINKHDTNSNQSFEDSHFFDDEYYYDTRFFKNKHFNRFLLVTIAVVILTFIASIILEGKNLNIIRVSNYYFIISISLLMLSAVMRTFAWSIHKKSVLKKHGDSEKDLILAKGKLKLFTKVIGFIGFISLLISIVLTIIMLITLK